MAKSRDTLLWEISARDGSISYLFGSMHLHQHEVVFRCAMLEDLVNACDIFAAEIDLEDQNIQVMPVGEILDDQFSLRDHFHPRQYLKYRNILLRIFKVDIGPLDHLPPMMITQLLSESVLASGRLETVDSYLWNMAGRLEKQRIGVESYLQQYEIMLQIPLDLQIRSIKQIAGNVRRFRRDLVQTFDLYKHQKIDLLYKKSKRQLGGLRKLLLYHRNLRMAQTISTIIGEHKTFVTVGAAHLGGKYGLIRLLKQADFRVSPILDWSKKDSLP